MEMDPEISEFVLGSVKRKKIRQVVGKKRRKLSRSVEGSENMENRSRSLSGKIRKIKGSGKKKRCITKKIKNPNQNCFNLIMQEICKKGVSGFTNLGVPESRTLNQTIDLCDDENLSESLTCINMEGEEIGLMFGKDETNKTEVIDLTENCMGIDRCEHVENLESTVIVLSEDEEKESQSESVQKSESSDDIFVIGTFSKNSKPKLNRSKKSKAVEFIPLSCRSNKINHLVNISVKVNNKYLKNKWKSHKDKNKNFCEEVFVKRLQPNLNLARIGENIYLNAPVTLPQSGLRPIIIDGSNVAFVNAKGHNFSCKRLEICIKYFKEKGHKVTAFVPQFRIESNNCDNPHLLKKLEHKGDVILTPSKKIDGRQIVPYDDRFIVQTAVLKGGIIVSRDKYKDLLRENPAWAVTIKYRTLAFTWVDDVLMFPKDPLGKCGPSLEEFLRF